MSRTSVKEAESRRFALLEDLYVRSGEMSSISHLAKKYNISSSFLTVLKKRGYITVNDDNLVEWKTKEVEPTEFLTHELFLQERSYRKGNEEHIKAEKEYQQKTENKVKFSSIVELSAIGTKYGISGKKLEQFVKEILSFINQNK